jgi:hypothetical protein
MLYEKGRNSVKNPENAASIIRVENGLFHLHHVVNKYFRNEGKIWQTIWYQTLHKDTHQLAL